MIGIFDSGLGGLTVVKEVFRQLPGYGVVYFGDTARMPYGNKSRKMVTRYALQDAEFLISKGAKVIVIACNTASALAFGALRRKLKVPVIEVVTPAVEKAAAAGGRRIGVIGTRGTVRSGVYESKMRLAAPRADVIPQACPLFVPLVEEGWARRPETVSIAKNYLRPLSLRRIDSLILGCTHYPFLKPVIRRVVGPRVQLIDPAHETVKRLKELIGSRPDLSAGLRRTTRHHFYVSDLTGQFAALARHWLGNDIKLHQTSLE